MRLTVFLELAYNKAKMDLRTDRGIVDNSDVVVCRSEEPQKTSFMIEDILAERQCPADDPANSLGLQNGPESALGNAMATEVPALHYVDFRPGMFYPEWFRVATSGAATPASSPHLSSPGIPFTRRFTAQHQCLDRSGNSFTV